MNKPIFMTHAEISAIQSARLENRYPPVDDLDKIGHFYMPVRPCPVCKAGTFVNQKCYCKDGWVIA